MLTDSDNGITMQTLTDPVSTASGFAEEMNDRGVKTSPLARVMRIEWLGQTAASLCWIASVFAYGISSSGDWLQLFAASSWLVANIASVAIVRTEGTSVVFGTVRKGREQ